MDFVEQIEEVQKAQVMELSKLKPTDPNFKYIVDNVQGLNNAKVNTIREENTRLSNNAANDVNLMKAQTEQRKAEIEYERVKTEKMKIGAGVLSDVMDTAKAIGFAWIAYNGDKVSYAIKNIYNMAQGYFKSRKRW